MMKKIALSAVVAAALSAPVANAATVTPASFTNGYVTAIDENAGTIAVDGTTMKVSRFQLDDVTLGAPVDVAYVNVGGRVNVLAVDPIDTDAMDDLVE